MPALVHGAGDIKTHMDSGLKEFSLVGKTDTCIAKYFITVCQVQCAKYSTYAQDA